MQTSGPLYLTIIQGPKTEVWYTKSKMGEHKLGSIMRTLAKTLNVESLQKAEESWTAKAQDHSVTGHVSECLLNDYNEVD